MLNRAIAPEIKPFGHLEIPPCQTQTLANGVELTTVTGGSSDVARLRIYIEGGAQDGDAAAALLTAEMLRYGNRNADSTRIDDIIDFNGAMFRSYATDHFIVIEISALTEKMGALTEILVDCVAEPTFPERELAVVRNKIASQQSINLNRVRYIAAVNNRKQICGATNPASRITTPSMIEETTRNQLLNFYSKCLDAPHMKAYLCGHIDERLIIEIANILERIPRRDLASPINIIPYEAEAPSTVQIDKPGSLQTAVNISLPAVPRSHPDYNPLRMAVTALGGYFGSRLMMNIREDKGYTYGINAALLGSREGSYININAECDNRYTRPLIDEVRKELIRMSTEPLDDIELDRLKFSVASDLAQTLDSVFTVMDYYELINSVGIPKDYFQARQRCIHTVDSRTLADISRRYFDPEQMRITIAGDLSLI